ncbi:DUF1538 domain-containing protein [Candidatus Desulforudis audaxviator]|uniref:DUF1538 domain-containing protein n=1 Tax=Desulforudis audaxviator (strain MP104C) TaxID=477974 RepID=B1I1U9_DESAP|nr:DUF1538 domain-containing protein [Candidatus Desulforudis audaxviator]ACA59020.1 protein of unknown function DUF1538 [Candidatus Desulforudis audaxviator MP104C]AZK59066.1 Protein of unknown function DUF1538 [Candidatus Desulforudis audaxviator]
MTGIAVFEGFGHTLLEAAEALVPLVVIFLVFQVLFLRLPVEAVGRILAGMVLAFAGLALFLQGVHAGFLPTGKALGEILGQLPGVWVVVPIGLLLGFVATVAEPAVRILSYEVEKVSGGYIPQKVLLYTLSIGVAVSVALAMLRIVYGIPLLYLLVPGYALALILIRASLPTFVSVAFDSGGVATGPMTVTFVMALAVGVAAGIEGRNPLLDGFGMIALVALAPILSVLVLGLIYSGRGADNESG